MPERQFGVGDSVMARWPGTSLYFSGKVLDYNDIEYLIKIEDEDESEIAVKYKDVEPPFGTRGRSTSRGRRGKSPARKSPARKSPARKSPARKSPSRGRPKRRSPSPSPTPQPEEKKKSPSPKKDEPTPKEESPKKEEKVVDEGDGPSTKLRHSPRIAALGQLKNSQEDNNSKLTVNNLKVDAKKIADSIQPRSRLSVFLSRVFAAIWATAVALPGPILILGIALLSTVMCITKKCTLQLPYLPRRLSSYYDQRAAVFSVGYFVSILLLALIPIGKKVQVQSGATVRCNGFLTLIAVGVASGLFLASDLTASLGLVLWRPIMCSLLAIGLFFSVLLYLKATFGRMDSPNPTGNTGYIVADFIRGKEIKPRIGFFDFKFFFFRASIILIVLLNFLIAAKDLQSKTGHYSPTLLVACGMQVFYSLDLILFEDSLLTTYEFLNRGLGLETIVEYLAMPFVYTIYSKFVLNHGTELPWYCLLGIVTLFLFGYTMVRGANSQKHTFRTKPADPTLAHLESLPTSTGQRLLVSGWWGIVRHPNYLGDIITQIAMALICGFTHALPWLLTAMSASYLFCRVFVVERSCHAKYGLAWSSYTSRVKYRLVPKVF